ncbi:Ldh family oxidoreductase [Pseudomonas chlororaphis]|uniref:Ldh family oxidoreductase n=1 Tax=Pseudomonas chlororaphis TaxID=587753 RepID=UPI003BA33F89
MIVGTPELTEVVVAILVASGTSPAIATDVARALVDADLTGYASHGVGLLESYLHDIEQGTIVPAAISLSSWRTATFLHVDACHGWGHAALMKAAIQAQETAREQGVCWVMLANGGHVGRLGYYVELLASGGCIGLATTASGLVPSQALVSASGQAERHLGSNPIAAAFPILGRDNFVFDASTAAVSYFRLREAKNQGVRLDRDALLDCNGLPSSDPSAFDAGGAIRPEAGHKGLGASIAMCLLCALAESEVPGPGIAGTVLVAIDPAVTSPGFTERSSVFLEALARLTSAKGISGWRASTRRRAAQASGLTLCSSTAESIERTLSRLQIPIPAFLRDS